MSWIQKSLTIARRACKEISSLGGLFIGSRYSEINDKINQKNNEKK